MLMNVAVVESASLFLQNCAELTWQDWTKQLADTSTVHDGGSNDVETRGARGWGIQARERLALPPFTAAILERVRRVVMVKHR
jgi:hypothetical protein